MSHAEKVALVAGVKPPALSISWNWPISPIDSGFLIFYADTLEQDLPAHPVCLCCVLDEAGEQVGRGMDMARRVRGQVDFDEVDDEWYVPEGGFRAATAGELVGS